MALLAVFLVIAVLGVVANVAMCLAVEKLYPGPFILPMFFAVSVGVFLIGWRIALRITEPAASPTPAVDRQRMVALLATVAQAPIVL